MKPSCNIWAAGLVGALAVMAMGGAVLAQQGTISSQPSGSSDTLATFLKEKRILFREWRALISQGATPEQLEAWQQQNAGRFQEQQQREEELAIASALQPMRVHQ